MAADFVTLDFLTWQGVDTLLGGLGVVLVTGLVWLMLFGSDRERPVTLEGWFKAGAIALAPVWLWLLGATLWGLWLLFNGMPSPLVREGAGSGSSLGLGALIAAFLGAPFVIYGTWLKHKTNRLEQEGHMTDRINKAVEQLGADKIVERIGRPVKIWTGKRSEFSWFKPGGEPALKARQLINSSKNSTSYHEETDDIAEGIDYEIHEWPQEVTLIEWQGEGIKKNPTDHVAEYGAWEVFKETVPNIEVRMGAILSLERIAQDSTIHDKGRDHVRVMEILCAYIRENTSIPDLSPKADEEGPFRVRTDVQMAIDVMKRRSQEQQKIEENARYRLDLKECDFRGADLSKGSFRGAIFVRCRFEFSQLNDSDFSGAEFSESVLNYVWAVRTKFIGARFHLIRIDKPQPVAGGFVRSINLGELKGASFAGANISAVQYLRENMPTFGTKDTILSVEMESQREEIIKKAKISGVTSIGNVESTGDVSSTFASWSPYEISDGMTGHLLTEFYDRVGLTGWPFRN